MQVKEAMTSVLETIGAEDSLRTAAQQMKALGVGVLPVVENGRAIGLLTDRDIVIRGIAAGLDVNMTRVRDVMTSEMWCLPQDRDVEEAARLMEDKQIRRILILNEREQIAGILSLGDLALRTHNQNLAGEIVEEVSKPSNPAR